MGVYIEWYVEVFKKYAVINGRAHRMEYWSFFFVNLAVGFILGFLEGLTGTAFFGNAGLLSAIYGLAVFIPGIAVAVRRLHDTGRSGWWLFIAIIPIVGTLILLYFLAQDGQYGDNQYGPNPKAL